MLRAAGFVYSHYKKYNQRNLLKKTPSIRSNANSPRQCKIFGRVELSQFSNSFFNRKGQQCVAYDFIFGRYHGRGGWRSLHHFTHNTPFIVRDEIGPVFTKLENLECILEHQSTEWHKLSQNDQRFLLDNILPKSIGSLSVEAMPQGFGFWIVERFVIVNSMVTAVGLYDESISGGTLSIGSEFGVISSVSR